MSMEAIAGSGRDGQEPFGLASVDGFFGEGEDAWLRRVMAEADADEAWIAEEFVEAAIAGLPAPGASRPGPAGLAQGGPAPSVPSAAPVPARRPRSRR
jgi:hypothetical protein